MKYKWNLRCFAYHVLTAACCVAQLFWCRRTSSPDGTSAPIMFTYLRKFLWWRLDRHEPFSLIVATSKAADSLAAVF